MIRRWEGKGFICSLVFLALLCGTISFSYAISWRFWLFSAAVGMSGWLTLLGQREASRLLAAEDAVFRSEMRALESKCAALAIKQTAEHHNVVPQEELTPEEREESAYWQHKYHQIHQQFLEKAQVLDQTRREFFQIESAFLALQKEIEARDVDELETELKAIGHLKAMEEELKEKEREISCLQECISGLTEPKKVVRPRKPKKKIEESLFPLFDRLTTASESPLPPP